MLVRCVVCGPPNGGKSSLVKRIVSHRFDNMPTRNDQFMGLPADGRHVMMLTMPTIALGPKAGKGGPQQVLLELQDQIEPTSRAALEEPTWWEVGEHGDMSGRTARPGDEQSLGGKLLEGLSPRSQFLGATKAVVDGNTMDGSDEFNTEHWAKRIDPRKGVAPPGVGGSAHGAGGGGGGGDGAGGGPQIRTGLPPEAEQHPLMSHQFQAKAAESAKPKMAAPAGVSPLTMEHGTHGWAVVFDLCSRASFDAASDMCKELLERVGYDRTSKRPCPIAIVLIGNKYDLTHKGKRSGVEQSAVLELLAAYAQPGALLSQLRKQKVDRTIFRLCEKIVSQRKQMEASLKGLQTPSGGGGRKPEEEEVQVTMANGSPGGGEEGGRGRQAGGGSREKMLGGISEREHKAVLKLKAALDPMSLAKGGGAGCTELDVLIGTLACLEHSAAQSMDSALLAEIHEALLACPALAIKYVPVSCKTNHHVHMCERVLLRALKLLPTGERAEMRRSAKARAAGGVGGLLEGVTSGVTTFLSNPIECLGFRRQ